MWPMQSLTTAAWPLLSFDQSYYFGPFQPVSWKLAKLCGNETTTDGNNERDDLLWCCQILDQFIGVLFVLRCVYIDLSHAHPWYYW